MDVIRRSRTSPQKTRRPAYPVENDGKRLRLIAKVARELVTSHTLTSFADLKDALRRRLLALRIRYQQHEFDDACSVVASNLPLVQLPAAARALDRRERLEPDRGLSKVEAASLMAQMPVAVKRMPAAAPSRIDIYAAVPREDHGEYDRY